MKTSEEKILQAKRYFVGFVAASGMIILFPMYGMFQERVMTHPYGTDFYTFTFQFAMFDKFMGAVIALICGIVARDDLRPAAPMWKYATVGIFRGSGAFLQYEGLKYLSYPTLMLARTFQMLPVMLWGFIISKKRYPITDWFFAVGVTGGAVMFVSLGKISDSNFHSSGFGFVFIFAILCIESLTLSWQEHMFQTYKMSAFNQFMWVNMFSSLIFLIALACDRHLIASFAFFQKHPSIIRDIAIACVGVACSQLCNFKILELFGALISATLLNIRQMAAIITSYVVYRHSITPWQIIGIIVVFSFCFGKAYYNYLSSKHNPEKAKLLEQRVEEALCHRKSCP